MCVLENRRGLALLQQRGRESEEDQIMTRVRDKARVWEGRCT